MTSSASVTSLCNRALLAVGSRTQISSINEDSPAANACATLYAPTCEAVFRSAPWNCLRKQATLTLLAAASGTPENPDGTAMPLPPAPYLYQYALPSDCLDVRYLVPSLPATAPGGAIPLTTASVTNAPPSYCDYQIDFAVAYATDATNAPIQVILTDQEQAQCVYTVNQPNPVIWDSLMEQAFVSTLAVYLVPALSLQMELMKIQIALAKEAMSQARIRDGDEGDTVQDRIPDWIRARNSGALYNYNGSGIGQNAFSDPVFPGSW